MFFSNFFKEYFFIKALLLLLLSTNVLAQFGVHQTDAFDEIYNRFYRITAENCMIKPTPDLYLPEETVSHIPDIKEVNVNPIFPNRTALLNIHNLAYARAFFFSYVLQTRFKRPAVNESKDAFEYDPGFMYYFLSACADVAANPRLNASAVYFQPHMAYTSSYKSFFNNTLPLFAPRAFRMDDYNDPVHLERISTMNFIQIDDLGAIPLEGMKSQNYTLEDYRINEWYRTWLPHRNKQQDVNLIFSVKIRYANNTNETVMFHGPNAPDERPGPVKFTRPYFDCGRSNKWLVPAVSAVADLYPRHTQFRHIEYPTFTAITVMEMDFERIDINQCPDGPGNKGPNWFKDTARCKKDTTECEPLDGFGFRRGGYQCRCKLQHRLPNMVRRPYLGEIIERATSYQYQNAFNCLPIQLIHKYPLNYGRMDEYYRRQYLAQSYFNISGPEAADSPSLNPDAVLDFIKLVTPQNCHSFLAEDLILRGDIAYGKEKQYENEARMALRLANFVSSFSQIVLPNEMFSGLRVVDRPLTEDQMMGEVLSILLGNSRVWSAGIYWDRNKFTSAALFAPLAYKTILNTRIFTMEDLARLNSSKEVYTNKAWFRRMKRRWSTNFDDLEKYYIKLKLRRDTNGTSPMRYEHYPTFYRAAEMRHGEWSGPEFDCSGPVKRWLIWYTAPFFGWDSLRAKLEFKGAVRVSMDLQKLDLNQCPGNEYEQNGFRDSHKCDRKTSYVVEAEYTNIVKDKQTRYDYLKCRLASAETIGASLVFIICMAIVSKLLARN
ncbi:putative G-protein coupled receptor [Armadillidium nasatum]|uniref:Putative G-protein coupled receptor n=1 Tax=Armadillidium nasatum TaxID=96803 RepID=A0A5N5SLS9_9CRUS|nr:putative G-protein coupled receptor [Armadillidium nasatum]